MALKNISDKPVGVIGAGSFGAAMANLLAVNQEVLLYARRPEVVEKVNDKGVCSGHEMNSRVQLTSDLKEVAERCHVIFPVVPGNSFRSMMKQLGPLLFPYHILIHGTKGLDVLLPEGQTMDDVDVLERSQVKTMSEVIMEESVVVRVGVVAGPNLARELAMHKPAATVVASRFQEVISLGQRLLRNDRFQVYASQDTIGVELSGVLKNIIAIASGAISGLDLGENARALLISRGMVEMIYLGRAMGGNVEAFIGLAGMGDLVATCTSKLSRNYTVGYRLAKGETLEEILNSMEETAEGIQTIRIVKKMAGDLGLRPPITETLYRVVFEGMPMENGLAYLMKYPFNADVGII